MNLLDVKDLNIRFDDKEVVKDISFSVAHREKVALVGESGSGKSVSAMSLMRLLPGSVVGGSAHYDGKDLLALSENEVRDLCSTELAMIFQEPMTALNPLYTVGHQIAEVYRLRKGLDSRSAWRLAVERLAETGIPEPARRAHSYPHQLSGGQRQRAMIAMALAGEPKLLLADEPTTALDVTLRLQILDLLAALQRKNGLSVLLITHDLQLVRRFADRVVVMQHGRIVEQGNTEDIFRSPRHPYTRQLLNSRPDRNVDDGDKAFAAQPLRLECNNLHVSYAVAGQGIASWFKSRRFTAVRGADFTLRPGRTLGVIGESGSGKTTLASAILGLVRHDGELTVEGTSWNQARRESGAARKRLRRKVQAVFQDPFTLRPGRTLGVIGESGSGKTTLASAILGLVRHDGELTVEGTSWNQARRESGAARKRLRRKVQAVFQDPYSSLSPRMSVADIVGEGLQFHHPHLSSQTRRERINAMLEEVGLTDAQFPGLLRRYPHEFSGGQRQRIAIARALIVEPDILVLDEPTSALDVTIQKQVITLLQRLQREHGLSYLIITHDVAVVAAMAHDIMVMKDGEVVEAGPADQVLGSLRHPYTRALVKAAA